VVALVARYDPGPQEQPPEVDDDEEVSEREIRAYLQVGHAAGIFEREDTEIVESLVDFFDTVVREVMTPAPTWWHCPTPRPRGGARRLRAVAQEPHSPLP
jgi:CBS domain containing-hemolysin-like protein